jgi:hypothetical protein
LKLHILTTDPVLYPLYGKNPKRKACRRRRLIFLSAKACFLAALEVSEYICIQSNNVPLAFVYIDKVDTTGLASELQVKSQAGSFAQALVRGYLTFAADYNLLDESVTGLLSDGQKLTDEQFDKTEKWLHFVGMAKRQFLFPTRGAVPDSKRVLTDSELMKWWIKLLESSRLSDKPMFTESYCFCPGEEERTFRASYLSKSKENSDWEWQYGVPFEPKKVARTCIPRFDDDVRGRLLSQSAKKERTVQELHDFLCFAPECNNRMAGFFACKFLGGGKDMSKPTREPSRPEEDFVTFINKLMELNFRTLEVAKESTGTLVKVLECFDCSEMTITPTSRSVNSAEEPETAKGVKRGPVVNVLSSSLVKRKRK